MEFYLGHPVAETTSYIVQAWRRRRRASTSPAMPMASGCALPATRLRRHLAPILARPEWTPAVDIAGLLDGCCSFSTRGRVMLPELPTGLQTSSRHARGPTPPVRLDVVAVSIANNHSTDLGDGPRAAMKARLEAAGIRVLDGPATVDLGALRAFALTDLDNAEGSALLDDDTLDAVRRSDAAPPVAAFMHWGTEFDPDPGEREDHLADALRSGAVSLVVGAHPLP
jgi:hypothetical protein